MFHAPRLRALKTPMTSRFLVCFVVALSAVRGRADAQLSERVAVEKALARPGLNERKEGQLEVARGRAELAGAYANPQLSYVREQTYGDAGTGEDYASVAQSIDLGGRRRLERRAMVSRVDASEQAAILQRLAIAADARTRFYDCRHGEERVRALEGWLAQVERALAIVTQRKAGGDTAEYDRLRLDRERVVVRGRLEVELARLAAARERLSALVGLPTNELATQGTLLPPSRSVPAHEQPLPSLRLLALERTSAALGVQASKRAWVPDLRIEGGYKGVGLNVGGRTDGFVLGASLALPLWDHGTGLRRAAAGEARTKAAEHLLLSLDLRGELAALSGELDALREAALHFRSDTARISTELIRISTAGYEGGELGLFELLDAFRGAAEDDLNALDMERNARRLAIELDRLTGESER